MFAHEDVDKKSLYLTNQYGQKLLKLLLKNEPTINGTVRHAQIKLIPYGITRAWVWRDQPSDPHIVTLHDGLDLTYHGGQKADNAPKVHLKATTGYTTLIDESLSLPDDTAHPVPLFSLETGYSNQWPAANPVTRASHVVCAANRQPVRFDLYLACADMDIAALWYVKKNDCRMKIPA